MLYACNAHAGSRHPCWGKSDCMRGHYCSSHQHFNASTGQGALEAHVCKVCPPGGGRFCNSPVSPELWSEYVPVSISGEIRKSQSEQDRQAMCVACYDASRDAFSSYLSVQRRAHTQFTTLAVHLPSEHC